MNTTPTRVKEDAPAPTKKKAPVKKAEPKVEEERKIKPLKMSALQIEEFAYLRFCATLTVDTPFEDVFEPEFWAHHISQFAKRPVTGERDKRGAIIEVRYEDHSFYAELYVQAVDKTGIMVSCIKEPVYMGPQELKHKLYDFQWDRGKEGYNIIRKSDKQIIGNALNFPTRTHVQAWLNHTL